MNSAREVAPQIGIVAACIGLGVARATFYRAQRLVSVPQANVPRASSPRALSVPEQHTILEWLHQPAYADLSPRTVFAMLLDAGRYLASVSTFYRLLRASGETRGRHNELTHPAYAKPELLATGPRELWSWDITKLKGPAKWVCFHLYVILDVFSRYVVGWMIAPRESAELAHELIAATCDKEGIVRGQLTLHADRGTSMRSKPVAMLLADLGVTRSHSRPHVSDDNPYSEAQFKTLKYQPDFPARFDSIENARAFCQGLRLVQPRPSALRHRLHAAGGRAHRPGAAALRRPPTGARSGVRRTSRTLHAPSSDPTRCAGTGRHQPSKTHAARTRGTAAFDTKPSATGVSKLLTHSEPSTWQLPACKSTRAASKLRRTFGPCRTSMSRAEP